ncbi:MAG TPA: T9SS type A sorting domain-containing protein, partial [Ignavibacteriaceae bacterium]|nr:T9SS type A sorting domain-containing protein [Ignavibacteriaceae bacterium]
MKSLILKTIIIIILFSIFSELPAQWSKMPGPFGANILSFISKDNYIIAGTSNGVYRTTNESLVWEFGNENLYGHEVLDLILFNDRIYAGGFHGMYTSSDNGLNWIPTGLANKIITQLTVKDTLLFAGTVSGLFVSADKGLTWGEIDSGLVSKYVTALASDSNLILVGTYTDGLYKSSDNGNTWIKTNIETQSIYAVTFIGKDILAASYNDDVYRSTDLGETWTKSEIGGDLSVQNFIIHEEKIFAATNDGLFFSIDNGVNWEPLNLSRIYVHDLIINGSFILAGTIQGAYFSTDSGLNWTERNDGLLSLDVTSLAYSDSKLFAGSFGIGVSLSTDNGETWITYNNNLSNRFLEGLCLKDDILLAGTYGGLFRTSSSLDLWQKVSKETGSKSFFVSNDEIFASSDNGVLRSTDNGNTWKKIDSVYEGVLIRSWAVLKINDIILASYNNRGIRVSTDNGLSWNYSNTGFPNYITINSLQLAESKILAGTAGGGVYFSTDTGTTWHQSELDTAQNWTMIGFDQFVFGGGGRGVCQSTDYGTTWKWINQGLGNYFVKSFAINDEYLFAGVVGGGVWRRAISELTSTPGKKENQLYFSLSQNYPNPFNSNTKINYRLLNSGLVTIKLFDLLGKEVATLVNEEKTPGEYSVELSVNNLPTGVYF